MRRLVLAIALAAGACGGPVPAGYQPETLEAAVRAVMAFAGQADPTRHVPVFMVDPECWQEPNPDKLVGFVAPSTSSYCVVGWTPPDHSAAYASTQGNKLYSQTSLCHEVAGHQVWERDAHTRAEVWRVGGWVDQAKAFLAGMPDIDRIEERPVTLERNATRTVVISTRRCCPAEAHRRLLADHHQLIQMTVPGARTNDPERLEGWVEMRHCIACEGTLSIRGTGETRWLYAISIRRGEALTFANTLEQVAEFLLEHQLPATVVTRYLFGLATDGQITLAEQLWLDHALETAGQR